MATKNSAKSVWEVLSKIDCKNHIEKKGDISYVSWTYAWAMTKDAFPDATFTKHTFTDNQQNVLPFMRDYKGNTFVQVSVTIQGETITEVYPVMDHKMQAINAEKKNKFNKDKFDGGRIPDATDINNAFQRALTKVLAYFGMGIHVYAGEDIPIGNIFFKQSEDDRKHLESYQLALKSCKDAKDINAVWKDKSPVYQKLSSSAQLEVEELIKSTRTRLKIAA